MFGVREPAFFLMVLLLGASLGGIATAQNPEEDTTQGQGLDYVTLPRNGGTVWTSTTILDNAGERFLQFVEPPEFTRTEEALQHPDLVPGDRGDQGGEPPVITQRRVTDYSYMQKDWTGGVHVDTVHGQTDGWLCICDAEFVMQNENGMAPSIPDRLINIEDSSRVWIDNITFYGGLVLLDGSEELVISNSLFIDSRGIYSDNSPFKGRTPSNEGLVHNITMINQRGPLNLAHKPNLPDPFGDLISEHPMCWPHNDVPCERTGILLIGGKDWIVEWSHIHGDGIISASSGQRNTILRHNTLYDAGKLGVSGGTNEISWNLVRGNWAGNNLITTASDYASIHNNSIINPFKYSRTDLASQAALRIINCLQCDIRNNDFVGYGRIQYGPDPAVHKLSVPALFLKDSIADGLTDATDNYWNTLHDPRIPEGVFIRIPDDARLILDSWQTESNHPLTPLVYTFDPDDVPYWTQQIINQAEPHL